MNFDLPQSSLGQGLSLPMETLPQPSTGGLPQGNAGDVSNLQTSTPLRAQAMPEIDVAGNISKGVKAQSDVMDLSAKRLEEQDAQVINNVMKEKNYNIELESGRKAFLSDIKGKVSFPTYKKMLDFSDHAADLQAKGIERLVSEHRTSLTGWIEGLQAPLELGIGAYADYESAMNTVNKKLADDIKDAEPAEAEKAKKLAEVEKQKILAAYMERKKRVAALASRAPGLEPGQPAMSPQQIEEYMKQDPNADKDILETMSSYHSAVKQQAEIEEKKARSAYEQAHAKRLEEGANCEQMALSQGYEFGTPEFEAAVKACRAGQGRGGAGADTLALTPEAIRFAIQRLRTGDKSALQNLGRNGKNVTLVANELGRMAANGEISAAELTAAQATLQGMMAGERTAGTIEARIGVSEAGLQRVIPLIKGVLPKLTRVQTTPVNTIIRKVREGTGSPDEAQFAEYVETLTADLAGIYARGGVPTNQTREMAEKALGMDRAPAAFVAGLDAAYAGAEATARAAGTVGRQVLNPLLGPASATSSPAATGAPPTPDPFKGVTFSTQSPRQLTKLLETTGKSWEALFSSPSYTAKDDARLYAEALKSTDPASKAFIDAHRQFTRQKMGAKQGTENGGVGGSASKQPPAQPAQAQIPSFTSLESYQAAIKAGKLGPGSKWKNEKGQVWVVQPDGSSKLVQ